VALNDTSSGPPPETVTRERVLPDSNPSEATLALLRSWRAEVEGARTPAFEALVAMSQNSKVPLRDVARAVLDLAEDE